MDHCDHEWKESYYGYDCAKCGAFIAFGCEPWAPIEDDEDFDDGEPYQDEFDGEDFDCGWVDDLKMCMDAGTEACAFDCPFRAELRRLAGYV